MKLLETVIHSIGMIRKISDDILPNIDGISLRTCDVVIEESRNCCVVFKSM